MVRIWNVIKEVMKLVTECQYTKYISATVISIKMHRLVLRYREIGAVMTLYSHNVKCIMDAELRSQYRELSQSAICTWMSSGLH